jgi:8-oxo-dGTP diphosphatase
MSKIPHGLKRVAVFCILRHADKFLLLKRAYQPNVGKYVPVGGKVDPYETPYEAVIRETKEETGIQLGGAKFCGILTETSPTEYNWLSYIYFADIDDIDIPYCDEGELHWVNISNLSSIPTPETDRFIYQFVAADKPFIFSAKYDAQLNLIQILNEIDATVVYS